MPNSRSVDSTKLFDMHSCEAVAWLSVKLWQCLFEVAELLQGTVGVHEVAGGRLFLSKSKRLCAAYLVAREREVPDREVERHCRRTSGRDLIVIRTPFPLPRLPLRSERQRLEVAREQSTGSLKLHEQHDTTTLCGTSQMHSRHWKYVVPKFLDRVQPSDGAVPSGQKPFPTVGGVMVLDCRCLPYSQGISAPTVTLGNRRM